MAAFKKIYTLEGLPSLVKGRLLKWVKTISVIVYITTDRVLDLRSSGIGLREFEYRINPCR